MKRGLRQLFLMGSFGAAGIALLLAIFNGGILTDWWLDTQWFLRGPFTLVDDEGNPVQKQVVIVEIDNETLRKYRGDREKLPRSIYASLVERLGEMGARKIGFDVHFTDPGVPEDDEALRAAIKKTGIVVANCALMYEDDFSNLRTVNRSFFVEDARAEGFADMPMERDHYIRRTRLYAPRGDLSTNVSLALAMYLADIGATQDEVRYFRSYIEIPRPGGFGSFTMPQDHLGRSLIGFLGGPGTLASESAASVLEGTADPAKFRDRVVLIGGIAEEFRDRFHTPFSRLGDMPGVEIHGHILENLYLGKLPREFSGPRWWAVMIFLGFMAGVIGGIIKPEKALFVYIGLGIFCSAAFSAAFYRFYVFMNLFDVVGALATGWAGSAIVDNLLLRREKSQIIALFGQYVSPNLMSEILESPDSISLGGARRETVVMFADVRGFTKLCEEHPPESVITFLNTYFSAVTAAIFEHHGVLDKYIGDGLMAFFGIPILHGNEADNAVDAAIAMQKALAALRAGKSRGSEFPIEQIGIGIHGGDVVVGNVGSIYHMEYTILGDNVNVAARLESECRQGEILISQWLHDRLTPEKYRVIPRGEIHVRGRSESLVTFEIRGHKADTVS